MKTLCFYSGEREKEFLLGKLGKETVFLQGDVQDYSDFSEYKETEIISCFTGSKFTAEQLQKFPNLKLIAVRSTGFDNIDLAYCSDHGIVVENVPFYGENTVAEYAFSLILDISRKSYYTYEKVKKDLNFSRRGTDEVQGFDLSGKTLGIVGMGHIGKNVAQIANGFDLKILAYDISPDESLSAKYGVEYVPLDDLLSRADIITIHLPYNKNTHHLFNTEIFGKMKKGMILINTSRGEIVDTLALKSALDSGIVSSAGLDVVEYEKFLGRESIIPEEETEEVKKVLSVIKEFIMMDNVIVTPHNAFNTREAIERILATTVDNINKFKNGEKQNVVEQHEGL